MSENPSWFKETKAVAMGLVINIVLLAVSWGSLTQKVSDHDERIQDIESKVENRVTRSQDLRERMIRVETLLETIIVEVKGINLDLKDIKTISESKDKRKIPSPGVGPRD